MDTAGSDCDEHDAVQLLEQQHLDNWEAQDCLLHAKTSQALSADAHRSPEPPLQVGDKVITSDGIEEAFIDCILDEHHVSCGRQYLVCWVGFGLEDDEWLPHEMLVDCEALDHWESRSTPNMPAPSEYV